MNYGKSLKAKYIKRCGSNGLLIVVPVVSIFLVTFVPSQTDPLPAISGVNGGDERFVKTIHLKLRFFLQQLNNNVNVAET